jgi:membrane-bound lytic murein transglycosylase A
MLQAMNRTLLRAASLGLFVLAAACKSSPNYDQALPDGMKALIPLGPKEKIPEFGPDWERRQDLLVAVDNSLAWTRRENAKQFFPTENVTHDRALRSLERFRELLASSLGPEDFQRALERDFQVYKSAGWDGLGGGVLFTAYCTPILKGSRKESASYRYPLYAMPPDLVKAKDGAVLGWETPGGRIPHYPTRKTIETKGLLKGRGLELVWLADPLDAFIAHVNGSAFIQLEEGGELRLGYAAKNGRAYTSLGKELEADGRIERASLPAIRDWAANTPEEEVLEYLHRNASYVFFTEIQGTPHGSLDVEVTGERSIATDKTLFPRGAITFVEADVPPATGAAPEPFQRFLMDQDTGGAIRTAGRADIYLGIGAEAEGRAGQTKSEGQLYYLFLKE